MVRTDTDLAQLHPLIDAIPWASSIAFYLRRLIEQIRAKALQYSPLGGIGDFRTIDFACEPDPAFDADERMEEILLQAVDEVGSQQKQEYKDVLEAFDRLRRVVVLGEPGAGKSTTLWKLALQLAERALESPAAPAPLFVELRDWKGSQPFGEFLAAVTPYRAQQTGNGRGWILLLDGLNEMPAGELRKEKAKQIRELRGVAGVFASCRAEDYTPELSLGCSTLRLAPLTPMRVRAALETWAANRPGIEPAEVDGLFWQIVGDERLKQVLQTWRDAGATEEEFWSAADPTDSEKAYGRTTAWEDQLWRDHIPNPRSLVRMAQNPYLLTMIFRIWATGGQTLPKNRGRLVRAFVESLLHREAPRIQEERRELVQGLTQLAWKMQRGEAGATVSVGEDVAVQVLGSEGRLILARDAKLLDGGGGGSWRFWHQLLQEYFAALALQEQLESFSAATLWPKRRWWERNAWEETVALLAGFGDLFRVVEWLADAQPEVAARCVLEREAAQQDEALRQQLRKRWQPRLLAEQRPHGRAAIGRALDLLGLDDRRGVGVRDGLPDIEWVRMPACEFLYQEEMEKRRLEEYEIGKYPVTNAQYEVFVQAEDGYNNDRWWRGMAVPAEHRRPEPSWWKEGNHPRERVSWWEAMAFCGWLSARTARDIGLPREEEWERAARGEEGREYPWGEGFDEKNANTAEGGIGRTTPVGIYPGGRTPEGVEEMVGNVWEWCLNEYDNPERIQTDGLASRSLRGGSWYDSSGDARTGFRSDYCPIDRGFDVGFRLVRRSPIKGR